MDTTKKILDLDGIVIKDQDGIADLTVGRAIARMLSVDTTKDPLRSYILAKDCFTDSIKEFNKADIDYIKELITSNKNYFAVVKGQVIEVLNDAEKKLSEKKETK